MPDPFAQRAAERMDPFAERAKEREASQAMNDPFASRAQERAAAAPAPKRLQKPLPQVSLNTPEPDPASLNDYTPTYTPPSQQFPAGLNTPLPGGGRDAQVQAGEEAMNAQHAADVRAAGEAGAVETLIKGAAVSVPSAAGTTARGLIPAATKPLIGPPRDPALESTYDLTDPTSETRAKNRMTREELQEYFKPALENVAAYVGEGIKSGLTSDQWKKQIELAQQGDLFGEGATNAWIANMTQQLGVMGVAFAGQAAGKAIGTLAAGPAGTEIGGHIGGFTMMAGLERGSFMEAADGMGINRSLASDYADAYGVLSGAVEYLQYVTRIGGVKSAAAAKKAMQSVVKKALKTIGGIAWEGFEELSQNTIQNVLMRSLVEKQNQKYGTNIQPPDIMEGGLQAAAVAVAFSSLLRGGGAAAGKLNRLRVKYGSSGVQAKALKNIMASDQYSEQEKQAIADAITEKIASGERLDIFQIAEDASKRVIEDPQVPSIETPADKQQRAVAELSEAAQAALEGKPIIAPAPAELPAATLPLGTAQMNEMARQDVEGPGPQVQANELSLAREDSGELVIAPEAAPQEAAPARPIVDSSGAELVDLDGTPVQADADGMITVYHRTTPEAAAKIRQTGEFVSAEDGKVFTSTAKTGQADGYGDEIVSLRVPANQTTLEDAFAGGEVHVSVPVSVAQNAQQVEQAPAQPTAVTSQVEGEVTASQVVSELPDVGDQTPVNMDGRPTRLQEPQPTAPDSSAILQQEPRAVQETDRELAARTRLEELAQRAPDGIPTETFTKQWNAAQAEYDAAVAEAQPGRENLDAAQAINRSATPQETIAAVSKRSLQPSVTRQVRVLLNSTMRAMSKAATGAWRAAAKNAVKTRKNLIEYAKQRLSTADLTDAENRRLVALVAKSGLETDPAKRTALQRSVIAAIEGIAYKADQRRAVSEVRSAISEARKFSTDPAVRSALDQMESEVAMARPRLSSIERAKSVFTAAMRDFENRIPRSVLLKAEKTFANLNKPQSLREMDPFDLRQLAVTLNRATEMAKAKATKEGQAVVRENESAVSEGVDLLTERHRTQYEDRATGEGKKRRLKRFKRAAALFVSAEKLLSDMFSRESKIYKLIYKGAAEGDKKAAKVIISAQKHIRSAADALVDGGHTVLDAWGDVKKGISFSVTGARVGSKKVTSLLLSKGEAMELYALMRQPASREALLRDAADGINLQDSDRDIVLSNDDLISIEEEIRKNHKDVAGMAESLQDFINTPEFKEYVNSVSRDLEGRDIATVFNYWTMRRTDMKVAEPNARIAQFVQMMLEHQSFLKSRTNNNRSLVIGNGLLTWTRHVQNVASYHGKAKVVHSAMRILGNKSIRDAVNERYADGKGMIERVQQAIDEYHGMNQVAASKTDQAIGWFIRHAHVGALATKPHIVAFQVVSLATAGTELGHANMARSAAEAAVTSMDSILEEWNKHVPELVLRYEAVGQNILTPNATQSTAGDMYGSKKGALMRLGMKAIHWADMQVMKAIWIASKHIATAEGLSGDAMMERAGELAMDAIRKTQPSSGAFDVAGLSLDSNRSKLLKMALMFTNQRFKHTAVVYGAVSDFARDQNKTAAKFSTMVGKIAVPTVINGAIIYGIRYGFDRLWDALWGDDDKKKEGLVDHLTGFLSTVFGNLPIAGQLAGGLVEGANHIRNGMSADRAADLVLRDNIIVGMTKDSVAAMLHLLVAWKQASGDETYKKSGSEKYKVSLAKATYNAGRAAGTATGVPTQAALQMAYPAIKKYMREPEGSGGRQFREPREPRATREQREHN